MGDVVNKIAITQTVVSTGAASKDYTVEVFWQLNGGSSCTYKGVYTLVLLEDGIKKTEKEFQDTEGDHYTEQNFSGLEKGKKYSILLRSNQGSTPVSSKENLLLLQSFENLTGCFDGQEISVYWGQISPQIKRGTLTLWTDSGLNYTCEVPVYSNFLKIRDIAFPPSEHIYLSITANDGIQAFGPESDMLEFYADACNIISLDYQQTDVQTGITLVVASWAKTTSDDTVQFVFRKQGKELFRKKGVKLSKEKDNIKITTDIPFTVFRKQEAASCELFCYWEKGNAVSNIESAGNHISLFVPRIKIQKRTAEEVIITWDYDGEFVPDYYITNQNKDEIEKIYDMTYTVPFEKADSFALAACFINEGQTKQGCFAGIPGVFQQGFYPVLQADGGLCCIYHQNSFAENEVSLYLSGKLFETEPQFPVVSGGIHLNKENENYLLTTDTKNPITETQYQDFLKNIQDALTPYGFYLLTEAISRMAYQKIADTSFFSNGYKAEHKICDLRPGSVLEIQTEIYMPQENPDMDNSAGFVTSFREEYPVSFPMKEDGEFLEFNSFVDGYGSYMDYSSDSDDTNTIYVGGLRDFLIPAARQPYYRIVYPNSLPGSGEAEISFPSENIILLAAKSYGQIQEATQSILEDPSAVNHLNIPVMLFRGRSTVWAAVHIMVNGESLKLPIGITLGKVLQKVGIYGHKGALPDNLKIYRRDMEGREFPVYWDWITCPAEEIVLVNGDRIEV